MNFSKTHTPSAFAPLSLLWYGMGAVVLGLLLARWTWIFFAPPALVALPPQSDAMNLTSATLLGISGISGVTVTDLSGLHLIGVFSGKQGFAIFRQEEKRQIGVALGEEIVSGIQLVEVSSDHALVLFNGAQQRVELENKFTNGKNSAVTRSDIASSPNAARVIKEWERAQQKISKGNGVSDARY
jgi:hypothetical protein